MLADLPAKPALPQNPPSALAIHERIAILVIHGIGQQRPYETLDQFARGLLNSFKASGTTWAIEPQLLSSKDPLHEQRQWIEATYRLIPPTPQSFVCQDEPNHRIKDITLFEYYWAPITQDKITYTGSLLFLIGAGLKPFKYLASNINILWTLNRSRLWIIILKELWRQTALFLPLILFLLGLLSWLGLQSPARLLDTIRSIPADTLLLVVILAIRYLYLFTTARALISSLKSTRTPVGSDPPPPSANHSPAVGEQAPTPSGNATEPSLFSRFVRPAPGENWQSSNAWRLGLLIGLAGHTVLWPFLLPPLARLVSRVGHWLAHGETWVPLSFGHWSAIFSALSRKTHFSLSETTSQTINSLIFLKPEIHHVEYISFTALALLAYFVRFILINYIGDVAVYVNADERTRNFAARIQILDECSRSLTRILKAVADPDDQESEPLYSRVLVAGHSLGSVIAYDTINELLNRARTADPTKHNHIQPHDLDNLRGMCTFGSPLNKIFYFFREQIDPRQSVRRQTLDLLRGFRVLPGLLKNPGAPIFLRNPDSRWAAAEHALESGFCWINAYALADPVSGKLAFYDLHGDVNQQRFHYLKFGLAHLEYWNDPDFYDFFRRRLL